MKTCKQFRVLTALIIGSLLFILSSCGGGGKNVLPKNDNGISLENLAPSNPNIAISYGAYDQSQRDNFQMLWGKFNIQPLWDKYTESLNVILAESNLTFENDIKPMVGDGYRVLVAMDWAGAPSDPVDPDNEADATIQLYKSGVAEDMVVAFTVADTKKAEEFMNLLSKNEGVILGDKDGHLTLTDTKSGTNFMLIDNFLILANLESSLDAVVSRYNGDIDSLADNTNYTDAFAAFDEPQIAYVYMNLGDLDTSENVTAITSNPFKLIDYQMYGISAKEDGLAFTGSASFNKKEMKKFEGDLSMFSGPGVYLADNLSADDIVLYLESYNLANTLRNNSVFADPSISDSFQSFFGSNLEDGLFSWMDKGYALSLQRDQWMIPGLTIAFDASSNSKAARDFYLKLDAQLTGYITISQDQLGDAMKKQTSGDLSTILIDLAPFDDGTFADQFPGVTPPILEFTYGLTDDDLFVISLKGKFADTYGKNSLSDDDKYNAALDKIGNLDGGIVYLDFANLTNYAKELFDIVLKMQAAQQKQMVGLLGASPEESAAQLAEAQAPVRKNFEQVITVLQNLDYAVFGSKIESSDFIKSGGYLRVK